MSKIIRDHQSSPPTPQPEFKFGAQKPEEQQLPPFTFRPEKSEGPPQSSGNHDKGDGLSPQQVLGPEQLASNGGPQPASASGLGTGSFKFTTYRFQSTHCQPVSGVGTVSGSSIQTRTQPPPGNVRPENPGDDEAKRNTPRVAAQATQAPTGIPSSGLGSNEFQPGTSQPRTTSLTQELHHIRQKMDTISRQLEALIVFGVFLICFMFLVFIVLIRSSSGCAFRCLDKR